jgi:hypothetical protein
MAGPKNRNLKNGIVLNAGGNSKPKGNGMISVQGSVGLIIGRTEIPIPRRSLNLNAE